jgi:iron complex transport system ATP-binding protein
VSAALPPGLPLVCRGLTVRFGDRAALTDVSLSIPAGQFLALAGPNGSGKTTLLRSALGFLHPSEGSLEVFGRPSEDLEVLERARWVSWVPQMESPRDDVRLYDYVLYGRFPYHGPLDAETAQDHAIAQQALREVGLWDRAQDGILSLSGGERQRAILARALAQTTPLLLLDEPTSHLDIAHQLDLFTRVRSLSRERGVTVVAAIHDLNLATRFADRIVVLSRGRVVADGRPQEVLSADLLARVWGILADLRPDPRTGLPYLIPQQLVSARPSGADLATKGPIHVVGGGGAASPYLRALVDGGYRVSAGVLPLLDSDTETAEALGIERAIEVPFAPIGPEARARNRELLDAARAIVVAPIAVGPSNLTNLEDLRGWVAKIPIYLVRDPPIQTRDFCGGAAVRAYADLVAAGAREVAGLDPLQEALARTAAVPAT